MNWINSADIEYKKPPLDDYLIDYNDKLADILFRNFSLKYLSSATINRLEGQTKFYEYLQKYVQICELLDNNQETCIQISEDDQILYGPLKKKYVHRISGKGNKYFFKLKLLFLPRVAFSFYLYVIGSFLSRLQPISRNEYDYVVRTYFDYRSIDENGELKDQYFEKMIDDLKTKGKLLIIYKVFRGRDYLKFIKLNSNGFDSVLVQYFLNFFTIIKVFISFLKSHINLDEKFIFYGLDCTEIIQLFLDEDYFKLRGLGTFAEREIATRVFNLDPDYILFPYENHMWEKMYPFTKKMLNHKAKITGYQHTGVSYKLLNYFPSKAESHLPIFPDKITTVGTIINDLLLWQANYPSEIAVGGALRFDKHFANSTLIEIENPDKTIQKKIAYAFSFDTGKYKKIIESLVDVFGDSDITVLLKFHPLYVEEEILKNFKYCLPANFIASGATDWNHIFRSVDLILYDDNSIAFEGMIHGVKTFSFAESEQIYDITRKFDFDIWKENLVIDDLVDIKNQLTDGVFDKGFDRDGVCAYINSYFEKYNSDKHLNEFL